MRAMARKTKKRIEQVQTQEKPQPKRYTPPICTMCAALPPANINYTEVYHVRKNGRFVVRYCKCRKCGNTFTDISRLP